MTEKLKLIIDKKSSHLNIEHWTIQRAQIPQQILPPQISIPLIVKLITELPVFPATVHLTNKKETVTTVQGKSENSNAGHEANVMSPLQVSSKVSTHCNILVQGD